MIDLAALVFRPADVPERALSLGFAVALGGWDVPAPHLLVAELPGVPGWSAAVYASGPVRRGLEAEELEHACELFEDALCPAACVLDAAAELGHPGAVVYAVTLAASGLHDDVARFSDAGVVRHFVREDEEGSGLEAGVEAHGQAEETALELGLPGDATEEEERAAEERAARPHRGTTFLSRELGAPALGALMGALYAAPRRVEVRLVEPAPAAVAAEATRLVTALRRVLGRGAFEPPARVQGVPAPAAYLAFARVYDWSDPADPGDLYRELSLGRVEGTLRFLREADLRRLDADPGWAGAAQAGLFPVAHRTSSALGAAGSQAATVLALDAGGERLVLMEPGRGARLAGPTFGELLRYLALGWTARTAWQEDQIGALMLRAKVRSDGA